MDCSCALVLLLAKGALLLAVVQLPLYWNVQTQEDVAGSELEVLLREASPRVQLVVRREPKIARLRFAPANPGVGSHARRFCAANVLPTGHHWPNGDRAPLLV